MDDDASRPAGGGGGARADALFAGALRDVHRETDRLFAWLLPLQWLAVIAVAVRRSPLAWSGASSRIHPNVWAAVLLGAAIVSLPTALALLAPGRWSTRQAVAIGQMVIGALLIHVCGGRIETHFHVFGSLAVLGFYRDWPVLLTASAVAAVDHVARGLYWPGSIYGVRYASPLRALEHIGWIALIDAFLVRSCLWSVREMRGVAERQAMLESTWAGIEETVRERTEELRRTAERLRDREARLSASAEFAAALNQTDPLATYEAALACLSRAVDLPCAVLFAVDPEGGPPDARCAVSVDGRTLKAAEFDGSGLAEEVARAGEPKTLRGPFPGDAFRLRLGLGEVGLDSLTGWPINFRGRCVGVLLAGHLRPLDDERRAMLRAALDQLAVRMSAFGVEEQRLHLLAGLREKSRALEEARTEAERANRVKSEFLAGMSHELRTPMNSIMGFTARLIRKLGGTLPEREMDALLTVDRNARHLLGLINDILDLSKIEAGKMELCRERLDLVQVAREAFEQAGSLADGRPIELRFEGPGGPLSLDADRVKLRQVALNLISNALKYTERGFVAVSVEAGDDPRLGPVARLSVRDSGVGIRPEDRDRLFRRFSQLDGGPNRKVGGTGLGLALSDRFAQLHGGRIEVESTFGVGSTFTAILPLGPAPRPGPPRRLPAPEPSGPGPQGVTVVCVDEEPDALAALRLDLEGSGRDVALARDGDAALEMVRRRRPEVLVLDLPLPDRDGFELLRAVHGSPELAAVPVVVVRATCEQARSLGAGARYYLAKPFDSRGLLDVVREVMIRPAGGVLIVEDNPEVAGLLAETLAGVGAEVRLARDGREGLGRLAESTPNLIVLDLLMPVMDGFAFLDHLRLDPVWKAIPVIILTARQLAPAELLRLRRVGATVLARGRDDARRVAETVLVAPGPGPPGGPP